MDPNIIIIIDIYIEFVNIIYIYIYIIKDFGVIIFILTNNLILHSKVRGDKKYKSIISKNKSNLLQVYRFYFLIYFLLY